MMSNPKAEAWNKIGGKFWTEGRKSARPSALELDLFTTGISATDRVVVVGASTKELVEELMGKGARVVTIDFSDQMCIDLRDAVPDADVRVVDVTRPIPHELVGTADWVLSDRLINRFDAAEAATGVSGMVSLLSGGGMLRQSVKIGLYAMDETMLAHARKAGVAHTFWDEATNTIDFSRAGVSLDSGILPHGEIDMDLLKQWYLGRGREKRFSDAEVRDLFEQAGCVVEQVQPFPDAPETLMYDSRYES